MQKILWGLIIVLFIAMGVLYYLYFNYTSSDEHKIKQANAAVSNSFKIAYFDLDSLQNNYEYYKRVRDYLKNKDAQMTQKLNQLRNSYVNKLKEYNQKGPSMSQKEQSEYQQQLMKLKIQNAI